jgi:peptidyl-prolyl cis-trans isomerase C
VGDIVARLQDTTGALQEGYATRPELVRELVDRMVVDRLLADEARRRGLENDPFVRAAVERALVARLRATVINPSADGSRPNEQEVAEWYEEHPERFHIPERRRARVVFVERERLRTANDVLRLALLVRRGQPAYDFRRLATLHNTEPTLRSMAGDIRDITAEPTPGGVEVDSAVRDAVFEIATDGQTLPRLVEGHWHGIPGYYIVNLVSRRRPEERTLQAQADWIRLRIMLQRRVNAERERVAALERERNITRVDVTRALRFERLTDAGRD